MDEVWRKICSKAQDETFDPFMNGETFKERVMELMLGSESWRKRDKSEGLLPDNGFIERHIEKPREKS